MDSMKSNLRVRQYIIYILLWMLFIGIGSVLSFAESDDISIVPLDSTDSVETSLEDSGQDGWRYALIEEYRNKKIDLDQELNELQENIQWLESKIRRRLKFNQSVSSRLFDSLDHKKRRLEFLKEAHAAVSLAISQYDLKKTQIKKKTLDPTSTKSACQASLEDRVEQFKIGDWVKVVPIGNELWIKTILPILFPSGSAVIADEYDPFLKKLALFLVGQRFWVYVDGYTDPDPIRTIRFPSNFELGAIRAANVVHHLIRNGLPPSSFKLATSGQYRLSEDRPLSPQKVLERYVNISIYFHCE